MHGGTTPRFDSPLRDAALLCDFSDNAAKKTVLPKASRWTDLQAPMVALHSNIVSLPYFVDDATFNHLTLHANGHLKHSVGQNTRNSGEEATPLKRIQGPQRCCGEAITTASLLHACSQITAAVVRACSSLALLPISCDAFRPDADGAPRSRAPCRDRLLPGWGGCLCFRKQLDLVHRPIWHACGLRS